MPEHLDDLPHILYLRDLLLGPLYFFLILYLLIKWRNKYYSNSPLKKYIVPAFIVKCICCVLLASIYEFYYGYGDSHNYFTGIHEIWDAATDSPRLALELIFKPFSQCSDEALQHCFHLTNYDYSLSVLTMFKVGGFIGLFCFGAYMPIALVLTFLSFIGIWKIFHAFTEAFPQHAGKIAISILFAPSALLWSTAIIKEPFCMFGLGLCVSFLNNALRSRLSLLSWLELLVGCLLLFLIKAYILAFFIIAGGFALYANFQQNNKRVVLKFIISLVVKTLVIGGILWLLIRTNSIVAESTPELLKNIEITQVVQVSMEGSTYVIPNTTDYSFMGIIRTYLLSTNVTLFRPYLWETPNLIGLASSMESFVILLATLYLIIRRKFFGFFTFSKIHPILTFSLVFTLLMAPLAGLVSFNFGTLARYKLPLVPFYYTYLLLQFYEVKKKPSKASTSQSSSV